MDLHRAHILITDDTPANIKIIVELLSDDYELSVATNGWECIIAAAENPPDLILLDVMMPDMDGYETCRRLKENEDTAHIPVIFMTAKSEQEDEEQGLTLGAVDYITKPFNMVIAKSRIDNQVELQLYRHKLEEMVKDQTEQLIHADRLAAMGTFSAGVAHEINNPTTYISGNVQTLQLFWRIAKPILEAHQDDDESGRVGSMLGEVENIFSGILKGASRIAKIVESLKTYARRGTTGEKEKVNLSEPIHDALTLIKNRINCGVMLETYLNEDLFVQGDSQKLSQVVVNLINNAIDALEGNKGTIEVTTTQKENLAVIHIKDNGCGMTKEVKERIFMPFFTTKDKANGTGLGMAIIESIIKEHKGSIQVESTPGQGTEFTICLPVYGS